MKVDRTATTLPATTDAYQSGTSYTTTGTGDGTWYLHVRAKDNAGNWSTAAAHFAFTVDSAVNPPVITSSTHPDQTDAYRSGDFRATWTPPVGGAGGYSVLVDATPTTVPPATITTTGTTHSTSKTDGTWYLHVRGIDNTGTWGDTAHYRFTVDTTPPAAPLVDSADYPADAWSGDAGLPGIFTATSQDARLARVSYRLDGGTTTTLNTRSATTRITLTPDTTGSHLLSVTATDTAGNTSAATTYTFHVGTAGLTAPLSGEQVGHIVSLAAAGPDDLTGATFHYRRSEANTWATIDPSSVTLAAGGKEATWPVGMTEGKTPMLNWNTDALTADGELRIRAVFTGANSPAPSDEVTVELRRVTTLSPGRTHTLVNPTVVQASALNIAQARAEASPETLAPPYLDQTSGEIIAPVTTAAAENTATAPIEVTDVPADQGSDDASLPDAPEEPDGSTTTEDGVADPAETTSATVTPDTRIVAHSQSELEQRIGGSQHH
ncbi:PKD domain-containing protein [Streptomyces sp. NPDC014889]|uniref:PKD domain-containing protein n=1 Tax=Streptomyces sp. NPDC014889 TaxID=3364928 RepID=UPI00370075B2